MIALFVSLVLATCTLTGMYVVIWLAVHDDY